MKKVLFLSLAVVLLLTQCKKETKIIEPTIKKQVNITFSTGNGSRLSISETGVVSWTNGDKIHIYSNNDGYLGYITTSDEGANFSGTVNAWTDDSDLTFYYLGNNTPTTGKDLKINFFDQSYSGTQSATNDLANISEKFFVTRHIFPSVAEGTTSFTGQMLNMVAVGIFDTSAFTDASTSNVKIYAASNLKNQITISSTGEMSYTVAGINETTDNQSGHIIIGPASSKRYVAMLPSSTSGATSVDLMFTSNGMATASALTTDIEANSFITDGGDAIAITDVSAVSATNYVDMAVASDYVFTVASGKTVKFAKGNLVYDQGRFKMHKEQYGMVGNGGTYTKVSGTFDYFGWGTSGWNNGNRLFMPYTYSKLSTDDYVYGKGYGYGPTDGTTFTYGLIGDYSNSDWGVYQFGMKASGNWRTLTNTEWDYLLTGRTASAVGEDDNAHYTMATITINARNIKGVIIFPDNYSAGTPDGVVWGTIDGYSDYTTTCASTGWAALESAGCIFIPSAGYRDGSSIKNSSTDCRYLSSMCYTSQNIYYYLANKTSNEVSKYGTRYYGYTIRLVQDVE